MNARFFLVAVTIVVAAGAFAAVSGCQSTAYSQLVIQKKSGCAKTNHYVAGAICKGPCQSSTLPHDVFPYYKLEDKDCCRAVETKLSVAYVDLCGQLETVNYRVPSKCACTKCSSLDL
eukprot:m.307077 g.307077  ORF g.307077 m.307077 type:complete len:118 (+) comp41871_c0_seq1:227-580(+)